MSPVNSTGQYKKRFLKKLGAKLDEMFMLTSHLKFYVSLNNLAVAPCVNGKSNIYRKSDLDLAVAKIPSLNSAFFHPTQCYRMQNIIPRWDLGILSNYSLVISEKII